MPALLSMTSDLDSKTLQILIVLQISSHRLSDNLSAFLSVLLLPLSVFDLDSLLFFLLGGWKQLCFSVAV